MAPTLERRQSMGPDNKPMLIGLILGSVFLTVVVLAIVIRDILKKRRMAKRPQKIRSSDISRPRTSHRRDESLLTILPGVGPFLRVNTDPSPIATPSRAYLSPSSADTPSREHFIYLDGDIQAQSPTSSSETHHSFRALHSPTPPPPYTSKASQSTTSLTSSEQTGHSIDQPVVTRKVKQSFDALFHDELSVRAGETLTVSKTFTDGWCLVGRTAGQYETEAGVVPFWCFQEPTGYRPRRPTRSKSLRKERKFSHSWVRQ